MGSEYMDDKKKNISFDIISALQKHDMGKAIHILMSCLKFTREELDQTPLMESIMLSYLEKDNLFIKAMQALQNILDGTEVIDKVAVECYLYRELVQNHIKQAEVLVQILFKISNFSYREKQEQLYIGMLKSARNINEAILGQLLPQEQSWIRQRCMEAYQYGFTVSEPIIFSNQMDLSFVIKNYPNINVYTIGSSYQRKMVLQYQSPCKEPIHIKKLFVKIKKQYQEKHFKEALMNARYLLSLGYFFEELYEVMGLLYWQMGILDFALSSFTVASEIGKNKEKYHSYIILLKDERKQEKRVSRNIRIEPTLPYCMEGIEQYISNGHSLEEAFEHVGLEIEEQRSVWTYLIGKYNMNGIHLFDEALKEKRKTLLK